jgi:hypothetical protein
MFEQQQHRVDRIKTHESGATEWKCDECGRHFVMQFEPYKRIILAKGNEEVSHCGGMLSGMTIGVPNAGIGEPGGDKDDSNDPQLH